MAFNARIDSHAFAISSAVAAGPKDSLIAFSLCHWLTPIASSTKLVEEPVLHADPPLTRIPAASNKSITSLLVSSFTAKLSVVGTECSKL